MNKYQIIFDSNPSREKINILGEGIDEDALLKKKVSPMTPCSFFVEDDNDNIVAGIYGHLLFGALSIKELWVKPELRDQGYGKLLMSKMEEYGKEKGCRFSILLTMDFQARSFYEKLGYYVEFEQEGFEEDSVGFFMRKDFIA